MLIVHLVSCSHNPLRYYYLYRVEIIINYEYVFTKIFKEFSSCFLAEASSKWWTYPSSSILTIILLFSHGISVEWIQMKIMMKIALVSKLSHDDENNYVEISFFFLSVWWGWRGNRIWNDAIRMTKKWGKRRRKVER